MSDIAEFLTARLTEMRYEANEWRETEDGPGEMDLRWYKVPSLTPGFVIADCDAKLKIIDLHQSDGGSDFRYCQTCGSGEPHEYPTPWPCDTLKLLALPYADKRGYREEWRP